MVCSSLIKDNERYGWVSDIYWQNERNQLNEKTIKFGFEVERV